MVDNVEIKETDMEEKMVKACVEITNDAQSRYNFDKVIVIQRRIL